MKMSSEGRMKNLRGMEQRIEGHSQIETEGVEGGGKGK
jgi:hypothetical protein